MKLEEEDRELLARLGTQRRSASALATALDRPADELTDRLAALADKGILKEVGEGRYERTESGRRVLVTSTGGAIDERIDTSPEVERTIDGFDLRADEADAVRHAFAFLRYWGRVTQSELCDAIYSEADAGRETPEQWWEEVVRDPLAALPGVEPPTTADGDWRYAGRPEADDDADGRRVLSRTHPVYGDVKHALESLDLTDAEREAAGAAFAYLYRRKEATGSDVREAVFPAHDAGFDSPERWWDVVREAFEALPGVERTNGETWRFQS